jgi:hypothetical protein
MGGWGKLFSRQPKFPLTTKAVAGRGKPQIPRLRSPGFPVETRGFDDLHAALFTESRMQVIISSAK